MEQQSLFGTPAGPRDREAGVKAKDDAIDAVRRNAPVGWKREAIEAGLTLASTKRPFTSEAITALAGKAPEPRALGAVVKMLYDSGLIRPTGRFIEATEVSRHRAPIREWIGV